MKDFLKYMFASMTGLVLLTILGVLFVIVSIIGAVSNAETVVKINRNTALIVELNSPIYENKSSNPFDEFDFNSMKPSKQNTLKGIIDNIHRAKLDTNIKCLILKPTIIPAGIETISEIREALLDFKTSGKPIYSYSEIYTQSSYYLASVADSIFINPAGAMEFKGLRVEIMFYKNILEKLGIEAQVIRAGSFKSAMEPFMYDHMSAENHLQLKSFIQSIWNNLLQDISSSRNISVVELNKLADNLSVRTAQNAVDFKLVDGAIYQDQFESKIKKFLNNDISKDYESLSLSKYSQVKYDEKQSSNKIAVIYAQGSIISGDEKGRVISSDRLSASIKDARENNSIKAIVLRVNSGGGSALASDVIWREMFLTKNVKPLIVSMGDYAASGGYYISCLADTIVASPYTLTGSIGVWGVLPNTKKFMNEMIGINIDTVKTNKLSDIGSVFRPMTAQERAIIQEGVDNIYNTFIDKVAKGRGLTNEYVDNIGQGRIWSGVDAKQKGLVDVLGGLNTAIKIAAEKANIEEYVVEDLPESKDNFIEIIKEMTGQVKENLIEDELGESYKYIQKIKSIQKIEGIQFKMPLEIELY